MARKLFGTDGVRGLAGEFLTADLALALGRAATERPASERPQVLIVRDTRESGEMLQSARRRRGQLGRWRRAARRRAADAGGAAADRALRLRPRGRCCRPRTTPTRTTASSSSPATATSSPTRPSARSSACSSASRSPAGTSIGRVRELHGAPEDYLRELHARFEELDLSGIDVLLDCANGATYHVAPEIFRRLGAQVTVDRRRAGRAQHQRRLRLDARRGARRARRRGRARARLRLRRRRRSRARGRPPGRGRRRR